MSRQTSFVLGARRSARVALAPLPAAIAQQLHAQRAPRRRAGLFAASALSLALLPALPAAAATITVDSAAAAADDALCQLPEAVANANTDTAGNDDCAAGSGADLIVFDPALQESSITVDAQLTVTDALTIDGAAAPGLALEGSGYSDTRLILADADLEVANLAMRNGNSDYGSAILAYGNLAVDNVEFTGNTAEFLGGAIEAYQALTVTNSRFYENEAGKYFPPFDYDIGHGGAIAAHAGLTITGSTFTGNEAHGAGGAVFAEAGGSIDSSSFSENDGMFGGAVFGGDPEPFFDFFDDAKGIEPAAPVALTITGSTFTGNTAASIPGASGQGNIPIGSAGGAVAFFPRPSVDGSLSHTLAVSGSTFTGNSAAPGGPPLPNGTSAKGEGKYFSMGGALAASVGPVFSVAKGAPVTDALDVVLEDSDFLDNFALMGGGAIVSGSSVTVDGSDFDGNAALFAGGASFGLKYSKYGMAGSTATLTDSSFTNNSAMYVGGVLAGAETLSASGLTVTGNIAGAPASYVPPTAKGEGAYLPEFTCDESSGKYVGGALLSGTSLALAGGNLVDGNCAGGAAGLVLQTNGSATVTAGTVISNNTAVAADGYAGGLEIAAAYGSTVLFQGTITGNSSSGPGGGALVDVEAEATVTFDGATISGNTAAGAGGGLMLDVLGGVTVANSTLSGNTAAQGGGLFVSQPLPPPPVSAAKGTAAAVLLRNVTVHGNAAIAPVVTAKGTATGVPGTGGGIAAAEASSLAIEFGTITGNTASDAGGGLWVAPTATVSLANSILADNAAPAGADLSGSATAAYTLVESPAGAVLAGTTNVTGVDPLLGPLQDNGGPTLTRLPLPGSVVINSGDPAFVPPPEFDQRGAGFPRVVSGTVDKGAVEAPPPQVVAISIDPALVAEGASALLTVTLDAAPGTDVLATVDFTGAALLGSDFTVTDADAQAGIQVLIPSGSTTGSATLSATDDALDEPDEGFTATVTSATGASVDGTVATSGTIGDGDASPMVTLTLSQDSIVEEGGTTTLTATLSAPSSQDVVVTLGYSGSATAGGDFNAATQIVIPAGQLSGSIVLTALDDAEDEGDETIVVDIVAVSNGLESGAQQGTIVITGGGEGTGTAPPPVPQPAVIPTLSEWMLLLLGLLLPATVASRLRRAEAPARRR